MYQYLICKTIQVIPPVPGFMILLLSICSLYILHGSEQYISIHNLNIIFEVNIKI